MVHHDAVGVVGHLGLVAELDRPAETSLGDGAGVGVVQRHDPRGPVGDLAGEAGAGLGHDLFERPLIVRSSSATRAVALPEAPRRPGERPAGVDGHDLGVFDGRLGDGGQLAGDGQDLVFGVVVTPAQPGRDLVGPAAHRTGAVPKPRAPGQPERLQRPTGLGQLGHPFGQQPESVG